MLSVKLVKSGLLSVLLTILGLQALQAQSQLNGRKLPPGFENFKAATDAAAWLVQQIPSK